MIGHYLTTALSSFRKTPFTTAANVLTLALGLACFIAAFGIATYWTSADRYHEGAERTFVLGQGFELGNGAADIPINPYATAAAANYLPGDFPEVERVARAHPMPKLAAAAGERKVLLESAFADPQFLSFFDFDFIAGDPAQALAQPGSVVLTKDAAERLFGQAPALGQRLLLGGTTDVTVTGVIAPVRQPSFMGTRPDAILRFDLIGDWDSSPRTAEMNGDEQWFSNQAMTFVRLAPGASVEALNARLPDFIARRMPADQRDIADVRLEIYPLGEVTTRALDNQLFAAGGLKLTAAGVLIGLGGLILLVAGVNYANLATAQAAQAGKEIGMRKVLGAARAQVMTQSWLTSLVQTLAAAVLALVALAAAAPPIETAMGVRILYFLSDGARAVLLIGAVVAVVALAAGAYPALVVSGVRPVQALRSGRSRTGPRFVARVLVGVQFAAASFLLILLAVSYLQRAHIEAIALTPREDPIVVLGEVQSIGVGGETLIAAMRRLPGVRSATVSERTPWTNSGSLVPLVRSPEAGAQELLTSLKHVGHDYFDTLGFELLAGRVFDRERETATHSIITPDPARAVPFVADEALIAALGFASPEAAVGQTIYAPVSVMRLAGGDAPQPMQIIGVTETDTVWLGANPFVGTFYLYGPDSPLGNGLFPILRIAPEDVSGTVAGITRVWDQFAPTTPADIRFFDQMFEDSYRQFSRIGQLFTLLAGVAFVIASLGLLGIAVHVAARRRHEIAVRKTLGSTTWGAVRLLLTDFSKPVIVGNLVAWPLGYFAAQTYLSAFAHRIELSIWPFVLSMLITLAIAWLAVGGQTFKAASVRPAQVLRDA
jgi:putative ABC transport system permease protein